LSDDAAERDRRIEMITLDEKKIGEK